MVGGGEVLTVDGVCAVHELSNEAKLNDAGSAAKGFDWAANETGAKGSPSKSELVGIVFGVDRTAEVLGDNAGISIADIAFGFEVDRDDLDFVLTELLLDSLEPLPLRGDAMSKFSL